MLKAPAFVSISRDIQSEFIQEGIPESKVHLIFNGIETARFEPVSPARRQQLRQELALPDTTLFVYAGKLNKGKGLELLLRAWKTVAEERPDGHLLLVGGGGGQHLSCEEDLKMFAQQSKLEKRVTFAGFQPAVSQYLQAADVFTFPSENEALSIALLEALSCELPCLASDISGNRDIIEDGRNGLLLPVHDEAAWSHAIRNFLTHPHKAAPLGKQGRMTVLEHFSIGRVAQQHMELFQSLAELGGRRP